MRENLNTQMKRRPSIEHLGEKGIIPQHFIDDIVWFFFFFCCGVFLFVVFLFSFVCHVFFDKQRIQTQTNKESAFFLS